MPVDVRPVAVALVRPLRHAVLRAGLPPESAVFEFDDDPAAVHFAADLDGRVVGCATLHPDAYDGAPAWRLRGMAVSPDVRRAGVGRRLLAAVDAHVRAVGPPRLWCNARTPAVPFYRDGGWETVSAEFDIPTAGPHFRMVKWFTATE